ncbi:hypothetical protein GHT06_020600 [Daphnia sinensis]|uniref:Uncharacterized protein n=1 Tax=Daphnia sinensis TaxID=1820382 RepID=A0AAD5PM71_9CRUS|nr:hypothetical protein GHT06_020600 [Daphnia sinensis]
MANKIFLLSLAFLASLSMAGCVEVKPDRLLSTLYEKSFQNHKGCIDQFNDKLSGFLLEIKGPEKANRTAIHRIGKEAEEILNRKVNAMMMHCNATSIQISPFVVTHMHKDGRNLYIEQLTVQKILIKPMLILDQTDINQTQILAIRINETVREKQRIKIANEKQSKELDALEIEIRKLEADLRNVTADRDVHAAEGQVHLNAFLEVDNVLKIEKEKFNELKATVDYIVKNACGCQTCRANQEPNWTSFLASRSP